MSQLINNLNSNYIATQNALAPRNAKQEVLVYVEGYEDIAFWYHILAPYAAQKNLRFNVQIPVKNGKFDKGKLGVLNLKPNVGKNLILCLDSDYDYLLDNPNINNQPFIFQTYTYAIENYKCFAPSLAPLCVQATCNSGVPDNIELLILQYSQIIYDLLIWSVWLHAQNDTTTYPISDFCVDIKIPSSPPIADFPAILQTIKQKLILKCQQLETTFSAQLADFQTLKNTLTNTKNLTPDTAYLFANGHTIKDNVTLMLLKSITTNLKTTQETNIRTLAHDIGQENNEYRNNTIKIEDLIPHNYNFTDCPLFHKIQSDIQHYIDTY